MNPTELFEAVYKSVIVQTERRGIQHPQLQDAAVGAAMDVLFRMTRSEEFRKQQGLRHFSKEVQTSTSENGLCSQQAEVGTSDQTVTMVPAGAENDSEEDLEITGGFSFA